VQRGLFDVVTHAPLSVYLDHAEIYPYRLAVCGNRQQRALLAMEGEQRAKIDVAENIAIHDEKGIVQIGHRGQRTGRAGRVIFVHDIDLKQFMQSLVLGQKGGKILAHVAQRQCCSIKTSVSQLAEDDLQNGQVTNRQ
jgi:hypothetical protein